jgi:hypothetical protein
MPRRLTKTCLKLVAVAFTSLVAPLTVRVVETNLAPESSAAAAGPTHPDRHGGSSAERVSTRGDSSTLVVGRATGKSAEEALRNAGLAAIREALAAEVDPATMALHGATWMEAVRGETRGIVRSWREVSARQEFRLAGIRYHSEVVVDVDLAVLRERAWGPPAVQLGPPVESRVAAAVAR